MYGCLKFWRVINSTAELPIERLQCKTYFDLSEGVNTQITVKRAGMSVMSTFLNPFLNLTVVYTL
jgi:hypothetical protein